MSPAKNYSPLLRERKWWPLLVASIFHLFLVGLIRFGLGTALIKPMGDMFSGFSGLALALVFAGLLNATSFMLATLFAWVWLRRFRYPNPFLIAVSAGASIAVAVSVIRDTDFGLSTQESVLIAAVICAVSYLVAYVLYSNSAELKTKIILQIILLTALYVGGGMYGSYYYKVKAKTYAISRGFEVYGISNNYIDTEYLRSSFSKVRFAKSRIETPKGKIVVRQGAEDEYTKTKLILPNKCDYNAIGSYIGIGGEKNVGGNTDGICKVVYRSQGRVIVAPVDAEDVLSDAPYIAKINTTVIVFQAYHSTAGDFQGTEDEALTYVIEFIKNARIISNEELGL